MMLAEKSAEIILNLSASPFTRGKENKRNRLFSKVSQKSGLPIAYCNAVGLQNNGKTVYNFDGGSCVYYPTGERSASLEPFEAGVKVIDTGSKFDLAGTELSDGEYLKRALEYGTKNFLEQVGCSKVVIGISGGIDSALAATVYSKLLPKNQLLLVNMPSQFNSDLTKHASKQLADNLDCLHTIVGIQESVDHSISQFKNIKVMQGDKGVEVDLNCSGFVTENIQARDRSARVLAGVASSFGGVFTCNANKSETTVGYSTLYGDHAGFFANLADLWKGQVYELAKLYNQLEGRELIPQQTIDMVPAAELNSAQDPSRGQGDPFCYPYHDALFSKWVEDWERKTPEEVLEWYAEGSLADHLQLEPDLISQLFPTVDTFIADMERWWRCYCGLGVAKRIQAPPILAFSRRAFGFDHREAQLGILYTKSYLEMKSSLLK
jgi:NAD+ synthase (glutamine-hydrolysing)